METRIKARYIWYLYCHGNWAMLTESLLVPYLRVRHAEVDKETYDWLTYGYQ